MSIATEITRLQNAKSALATSIGNKGVTVPSSTKLDGYAALVDSIQTGGGSSGWVDIVEGNTTAVTIPSGITKIMASLFYGRTDVTSVIVPDGVTIIKFGLCYGCSYLTSVTLPTSLIEIHGDTFRGCNRLTTINGLSNVEIIDGYVFYGCSGLTSMSLPSIKKFQNTRCLYGCSGLSFIDLGSNLTNIVGNNFDGCTNLTTIVCRASTPPTLGNTNAFNNTPFKSGGTGGTIYVPSASINSYKSANNWATVYGWGATTFSAIEGSIYE